MADGSGRQGEAEQIADLAAADQRGAMERLAATYRQEREDKLRPPLTEAERQEQAGFHSLPVTDDVRAHLATEQEGVRAYRRLWAIVGWIVVGIAVGVLLIGSGAGGSGYLLLALAILVVAVLLWFAGRRWLVPRSDAVRAYRVQSAYRYAGECTIGEIHTSFSGKTDFFYRLILPSPPAPPELTGITFGNWEQHPAWAGTAWRTIEFALTKEPAKTAGRQRLDNLLHVLLSLVTFYRPFALGGGAQGVMLTIRDDHDVLIYDYRNEYVGRAPALPPPPRMISRRAVLLGTGGVVALGAASGALWHVTHPPTPYRVLTGPAGTPDTLVFAPDGQTLAAANEFTASTKEFTILLWRVSDGTVARQLAGHTDLINGLVYAPDGQTLVSAGQDKTLRFWRASDGALLRTVQTAGFLEAVASAPDGRTVATGGYDGTATLWQVSDGTPARALSQQPPSSIFSLAFSPDGQTLATGHGNGMIGLWRASDGALLRMMKSPGSTYTATEVRTVAFAPDGQTLLTSGDTAADLWRVSDGTLLRTIGHFPGVIYRALFAPDGQTLALASGFGRGAVTIWRVADGSLVRSLDLPKYESARGLAFAPDGKTLACGQNQAIRLWQLT